MAMAAASENSTTDKGSTISRNDAFSVENNGTAKFLGPGTSRCDDQTMKATKSTTKRSLRAELSKSELLNMLCFLEGELQAHQIVLAVLKNERVKNLVHLLKTEKPSINDPNAALFRDKVALSGNIVSRQSSVTAVQAEMEVRAVIEQQVASLCQMVIKQRDTHCRIVKLLTESRESNQRLRQELEEEKRKYEHDTAQGDDITYGLEMERTKLKQELETEITNRKKLEEDLKKLQETLDILHDREKNMVLFLMAERKLIITKYVEERKRSEDLAQILSEEKQRSDTIAEDLEEESKKSLRMEAELEKQTLSIENERKTMKLNLAKEEKRIKELETELAQLRIENESLRKQSVPLRIQSSHNVPAPTLPAKIRSVSDDPNTVAQSSMVNVAKIVQPTATVSSVPVSGPTTGIARSISPGQSLRQQQATISNENISSAPPAKVTPRKLSNSNIGGNIITAAVMVQQQQHQQHQPSSPLTCLSTTIGQMDITTNVSSINQSIIQSLQQQQQPMTAQSTTLAGAISLGKVVATQMSSPSSPIIINQQQQTATILRSGGIACSTIGTGTSQLTNFITSSTSLTTSTTSVATAGTASSSSSGVVGGNVNIASISVPGSRGVPPPIPPNKPIIPPKREPSISRLGPIAANNISSNTTS